MALPTKQELVDLAFEITPKLNEIARSVPQAHLQEFEEFVKASTPFSNWIIKVSGLNTFNQAQKSLCQQTFVSLNEVNSAANQRESSLIKL